MTGIFATLHQFYAKAAAGINDLCFTKLSAPGGTGGTTGGGDPLSKIESSFTAFFDAVTPYVYILCAAAVIIIGVMCIVGGEEGRMKAKKWFPWVAIGAILICGAVTIGKWIVSLTSF